MIAPLYCILVPALLAGIIWGLAWRMWKRRAEAADGAGYWGALAVAAAFAGCYGLLDGWPGMPPLLAEGWLPFAAGAAVLVALLAHLIKRGRALLWLALFVAAEFVLTARPRGSWPMWVTAMWLVGGGLGSVVVLLSINRFAEKQRGTALALALWIWTAGTGVALALTGSLKYAQFAASVSAAMGAGVVAAWINPKISFARGAVETLALLTLGLLLCGYLYSDLPASPALLLAVAPLSLWLAECQCVEKLAAWQRAAIRLALMALPVAVALLIAAWPMIFSKAAEPGYY